MERQLVLTTSAAICAQLDVLRQRQLIQRARVTNLAAYYMLKRKRKPYRKKLAWIFEMNNRFWEMSAPLMDDARFKCKYRVERCTFNYLVEALKTRMERQVTSMRRPIPVDKRLAISLHCLKSGADYDTISTAYGIGKSSVGPILKDTCRAICSAFGTTKIKIPTQDTDLDDVVLGFRCRWNFPGCVGASDGTHFPILAPTFCPEDFYNYKGWKSIQAIALVDHQYKFRYVSVGAAGKNSDSSVYQNSTLSSEALQNELFPDGTDYHIIGDSAFALKENMMKPYPEHKGLTPQQFNFNYRLSRARMVVECAFGRLKSRWRILMKRCDLKTEDIPLIIMTCCILHNICEERKDEVYSTWMNDYTQHLINYPQPLTSYGRDYWSTATEKRDNLAHKLYTDGVTAFQLPDTEESIFQVISSLTE